MAAASTGGGNYNRYGTPKTSINNSASRNALKSKPLHGLRKSCPALLSTAAKDTTGVSGRVRVAVRLRPRNTEELMEDADYADCVELQSELKRLKLRKNNWDTNTYEFDEVLTEFSSQKRVYEVVAKPVVESVLEGYNGTIMAYGQTGTGKTYTLGRLGEDDAADRGIMVRAMEDIFVNVSLESDSISISYLQLYMESIQDLLDPSKDSISIIEDPKSGDVSLPGATLVEIRDLKSFLELLRVGEANRFAANTKLNTESSRSHAILMVYVKRSLKGTELIFPSENGGNSHVATTLKPPVVRKAKLVVLDLAGSERISKSGSEGHTFEEAKCINLSLSSLGKCINALAENSAHIPVRDSKLTRLLRDSFGGTARTSLVITIGPSPRHRGETASTVMFGQRAMRVENMLKLKEEFDYKSLSRGLEIQLDKLVVENERQQKALKDEIERRSIEAQNKITEAERNYSDELEKERSKYKKEFMESVKKLEEKWAMTQQQLRSENISVRQKDDRFNIPCNGKGISMVSAIDEVAEVKTLLKIETELRKASEEELDNLKFQIADLKKELSENPEILYLRTMLEEEAHQREKLEREIAMLQTQLLQLSYEADETKRRLDRGESESVPGGLIPFVSQSRHPQIKDSGDEENGSIATLFEQVGLQKILALLEAEDADVRIHAVKVVANLAAEEANQQKIVEAGGLKSLLKLLRSSEDETIHKVAAGAIANLAMNAFNQDMIMAEGGISLLAKTATNAEDPQTLRMVAGAIANLCGNDKMQPELIGEGGIKALLGMVRCGNPDVLAQVARGIANFAKCDSKASSAGSKTRKSLLIEDGALPWIVQNANNEDSSIRRHTELALCHIAQHEVNAKDMISRGALRELVRISRDCSRRDIRSLAHQALTSSPTFLAELKRQQIAFKLVRVQSGYVEYV